MNDKKWWVDLVNFLRLSHEEEDHAIIHETIQNGIIFRGTNLWILIFAILVCSVGLNMNSTAVVIGAMLISPLMGPINGIGYSVATYDFKLLRSSLNNFGFATTAALVTSTLYFVLTPIRAEHAELLSRTSPTIYDVLIAGFGGLAGIVAISSKNKGNVIPGVAIATALMPPLCTAGYGLSIGNMSYFLGALYLFLINSVFIALSAMLVTQLLKLPRKMSLLSSQIKNKNIAVAVVIGVTVLPSFYLGYTLVQKEKFIEKAEDFVSKVDDWEGNYLLDSYIDGDTKTITLVFGGTSLDELAKERLRKKKNSFGLQDAKVEVEQVLDNGRSILDEKRSQVDEMSAQILRLKKTLKYQELSMDSLRQIPNKGKVLLGEINAIFPNIIGCTYSESLSYVDSIPEARPITIVSLEIQDSVKVSDKIRLENWLRKRLNKSKIVVHY